MFKSQGSLPVTNEPIPNQVSIQSDYYLSYNPSSRDYGCATTAIVLGKSALFFILMGDHQKALAAAVEQNGKQAVIDYFIDNIDKAHGMGDHKAACGKGEGVLWLEEYGLKYLGAENIARLKAAIDPTPSPSGLAAAG